MIVNILHIIGKNSIVVCLSDQNFVPTLTAKGGGCLNVVRVENACLAPNLTWDDAAHRSMLVSGLLWLHQPADTPGSLEMPRNLNE